jgi:hypothetical protein
LESMLFWEYRNQSTDRVCAAVNTSPFWQEVQLRLLSIKQSCSQIADYCAHLRRSRSRENGEEGRWV